LLAPESAGGAHSAPQTPWEGSRRKVKEQRREGREGEEVGRKERKNKEKEELGKMGREGEGRKEKGEREGKPAVYAPWPKILDLPISRPMVLYVSMNETVSMT